MKPYTPLILFGSLLSLTHAFLIPSHLPDGHYSVLEPTDGGNRETLIRRGEPRKPKFMEYKAKNDADSETGPFPMLKTDKLGMKGAYAEPGHDFRSTTGTGNAFWPLFDLLNPRPKFNGTRHTMKLNCVHDVEKFDPKDGDEVRRKMVGWCSLKKPTVMKHTVHHFLSKSGKLAAFVCNYDEELPAVCEPQFVKEIDKRLNEVCGKTTPGSMYSAFTKTEYGRTVVGEKVCTRRTEDVNRPPWGKGMRIAVENEFVEYANMSTQLNPSIKEQTDREKELEEEENKKKKQEAEETAKKQEAEEAEEGGIAPRFIRRLFRI
ncbi:hypothetical protein G7046_g8809 [Stylonectria norvegica]|nr:hypothetical protein G7046_g8809 [Stylonectria norvegica]